MAKSPTTLKANPLWRQIATFLMAMGLPALMIQTVIFAPFAPLPWLIYMIGRKNIWWGVASTAGSMALLCIPWKASGVAGFLPIGMFLGVLAFFLMIGIQRRLGFVRTIALSTMGIVSLSLIALISFWSIKGANFPAMLEAEIANSIREAGTMMKSVNSQNALQYQEIFSSPELSARMMLFQLPFVFVAATLLTSWANMLLITRQTDLGVRLGILKSTHELLAFRTPMICVWMFIVLGASWAASVHFNADQRIVSLTVGSLELLGIIFGLHGLSVISFYLRKLKIRGLFKALILGIFLYPAVIVTAGIGLFDHFFNFRDRLKAATIRRS